MLTTASITVNSGDPWRFNSVGTGLELEGIGGTWVVPAKLYWKRLAGDTNAIMGIDRTLTEESVHINLPVNSSMIHISSLHVGVPSGGGNCMTCWHDDGVTPLFRVDIDGIHTVGGTFSSTVNIPTTANIGIAEVATLNADEAYIAYEEVVAALFTNATATNLTITNAITLSDSTDNIIGDLSLAATDYIDVGNPTGAGLTFRVAGSVNGLYGLFSEDVHALGGVYGSEGVIVGFGRQDHSHDGALWIASDGTNGVPTAGWQETKVRTTTSGCFFYNHAASAEVGSVDQRFDFDDEVRATQLNENTARVVIPSRVTNGSGIDITSNDTAGTVVVACNDTLDKVTTRGASTGNSISVAGINIGTGTNITKHLSATGTLNFDLTAVVVEDLTITVTGAADGDTVSVGVPNGSVTTTVQYTGWVSAADTVTVRARTSAAGENPASGTFRADVWKH